MVIVVDSKNSLFAPAFSLLGAVRLLETSEITRSALRDADAVIVRGETVVGDALLAGTPVRFVGSATIGTDHVDLEYLQRRGIAFANAPGSNANSVAEYVAAALCVLRRRGMLPRTGATLGIVGVGNIGSRMVHIGEALGMQTLLNDPPLARSTGEHKFLPLDSLMRADVITLHVPLTMGGIDRTYHLFDEQRLAAMKIGAILVNTSRGAVVDTRALHTALQSDRLSAAVLDVWEHEPAIDPALLRDVTLGTPHIAGYSLDGKVNAARMLFDALSKHAGIRERWRLDTSLPPPHRTSIKVPDLASMPEDIVPLCYDIEEDDRRLRDGLRGGGKSLGAHFRRLRAEYPVRREFGSTRIDIVSADPVLQRSLALLGFEVTGPSQLHDNTPIPTP